MLLLVKFALNRLIRKGQLHIINDDGKTIIIGDVSSHRKVTIQLHDPKLLNKLMFNFSLALGEAYMDKTLTIEEGDIYQLLELFAINFQDSKTLPWEYITNLFQPVAKIGQQYNNLTRSKARVSHHYDLSYSLYKLFLDEDLQYSCAYFNSLEDSLETAQLQKKAHISAKLRLKPGMKVLDIGCGWGGMAIYLARTKNVEVVGLTLSEEQLKIAQSRAEKLGLSDKVKFYLRDYRKETDQYDRIVSVGMFEHVGANHFKEYFKKVKALLKDDGVALIHSIGRMDGPSTTNPWLRKYIFPSGYAPALSEVLPVIEKLGLWTTDIEILRLHYAETLKHWRLRFNQNRAEIENLYDEKFCRMWEFYLIGAEMDFRYLNTMVFQIQLTKKIDALPIVRDYML